MFSVTVNATSLSDLRGKVLDLLADLNPAIVESEVESNVVNDGAEPCTPEEVKEAPVEKVKKQTVKKEKEAPKTETPKTETPKTDAKTTKTKAVTKDDTLKALSDLNKSKGIEVAKATLTEFGAARISELQPEHFETFVTRCAELM